MTKESTACDVALALRTDAAEYASPRTQRACEYELFRLQLTPGGPMPDGCPSIITTLFAGAPPVLHVGGRHVRSSPCNA